MQVAWHGKLAGFGTVRQHWARHVARPAAALHSIRIIGAVLYTAIGAHAYTVTGSNRSIGAVVEDWDFTRQSDSAGKMLNDLNEYKVMVFRNQHPSFADGEAHCRVARGLDIIDEGRIQKHPKTPRLGVYRMSNNPAEGKVLYQASWWHVDGLARKTPVRYTSLYNVKNAAPATVKYGTTKFVPTHRFFHEQDKATRDLWSHRYWLRDVKNDASYTLQEANRMSPLVYTHPWTGEVSIAIETPEEGIGFVDWVNDRWVLVDGDEANRFIEELQLKLDAACERYGYEHHWQEGDFIIWDNMAVIHKADSVAYLTSEQAKERGMPYHERTLQRVTIVTETRRDKQPSKEVEDAVFQSNAGFIERRLKSKPDFTYLFAQDSERVQSTYNV